MQKFNLKYLAFIGLSLVLAVVVLPRLLRAHVPLSLSNGRAELHVHYSPQENLEAIDVRMLRNAHRNVQMAAYSLTDYAVIDALKYAAMNGALVSVYLDNEQTEEEMRRPALRNALLDLAATRNVQVCVKRSHVLQHTKAYLIDMSVLREGSANFSPSALKQQDNTLLLTTDSNAVGSFEHSYEMEWGRPDNVPLVQFAQTIR